MRKGQASPHFANDPDTPKPWLPSRTCSGSGMRRAFSTLFFARSVTPGPTSQTLATERFRSKAKLSCRAFGPVGVGIAIARDPLRRSGQALLTHPAPTLGDNAQALERIGMTNANRGEPAL